VRKLTNKDIARIVKQWVRYERAHSMSLWQGDWKLINLNGEERWIIAFMDDASRVVTCFGVFDDVVENITLKDRWFTCPKCGLETDRDYNASLNILDVGLGLSRMPVEGEPLPLVIPYRKVIEGQVLSVKREAPCVSEG